jgi:hypothetical protein
MPYVHAPTPPSHSDCLHLHFGQHQRHQDHRQCVTPASPSTPILQLQKVGKQTLHIKHNAIGVLSQFTSQYAIVHLTFLTALLVLADNHSALSKVILLFCQGKMEKP